MVDLGELNVTVQSEGTDEAAEEIQDASEGDGGGGLLSGVSGPGGGGGGGGALGSLMVTLGSMSSAMMGILGVVGIIAALLASLKPIQKMISALFKVIQAFIMPLAVMLMRLLQPVLGFLLRLLPAWYSFLSDPQGMIQEAMAWLEGALMDMADRIVTKLNPLDNGESGFGGFTGDPGTSLTDYGGLLPFLFSEATSGDPGPPPSQRDTNINLFGGLGAFVDRITRDETTEFTAGPGP